MLFTHLLRVLTLVIGRIYTQPARAGSLFDRCQLTPYTVGGDQDFPS